MPVYFVHNESEGTVKIGKAIDVPKRVRQLQTASSAPLRLLGQILGGHPEERRIHRDLKEHRRRGEWFEANGTVMEYVRRVLDQNRTARTVQEELDRRSDCRYGLRGVRVLILPIDLTAEIQYSVWGAGQELFLTFDLDGERQKFAASDCLLLSDWPVVCRCWCADE